MQAVGLVAAILLVASLPSLARAQALLPSTTVAAPPWSSLQVFDPVWFARDWSRDPTIALEPEDLPVKVRQQPGYEPVGLRAGPWMFYPSITAGATYDSNVFATGSGKKADIYSTVEPSLAISSLWERNALDVAASVRDIRHASFSGLDQTDATLQARGRLDVWHDAAILGSLKVAHLNEGVGSLTSPAGAVEPTPYDLFSGDVTYWQRFNRFAVSAGVRADNYNFGSTRAQDGTIIDQSSRDGTVVVGHARADYAITGHLGIFSAIEVNRRDLRGTTAQSLSSDGYRSLSGFNFLLGHLISGEIGAGYAKQRFEDPAIGNVEGPSYRAMLTWSVTRLLDVHLRAEQIVTQAADTAVNGIRADAFQIAADYELRRDTILSLATTFERDRFFGQVRDDDVFSTEAELKHLFNRFSSISLRYRYFRRDSNVAGASYDKHEVGLNVTARY